MGLFSFIGKLLFPEARHNAKVSKPGSRTWNIKTSDEFVWAMSRVRGGSDDKFIVHDTVRNVDGAFTATEVNILLNHAKRMNYPNLDLSNLEK
jgi:hypothetical protein